MYYTFIDIQVCVSIYIYKVPILLEASKGKGMSNEIA